MDQRKTRLHDLDGVGTKEFDMPHQALKYAHDKRITGYVIDPEGSVVELKKGVKREDGRSGSPG